MKSIRSQVVSAPALTFIIIASLISGCSGPAVDYSLVDLVQASGTVTLDGKPLPNAVVTFEDVSDDTMSYAKTDADGNYTLQFDSEMSGVKVGKKVVRISTTRRLLALASEPGEEEGAADDDPEAGGRKKPVELVPEKYNQNSELTADVVQGTTRYDFALLSQ